MTITAVRTSAPRVTVHTEAIAANARTIRAAMSAELMAVVKADGYGLGAVDVATAALAGGATRLGVTSVAEALELRAAGLAAPLLSWLNPVDADFEAAVAADVELGVSSPELLAAMPRGARIHLHLDTGLARDGADPRRWDELCRLAATSERDDAVTVVGIMSHLGSATDPWDPASREAVARFSDGNKTAAAHGLRPRVRHLGATAAALTNRPSHFDLVRVGAGLVGIDPSRTRWLQPAFSLDAPVVDVRRVDVGTGVGYGHAWHADRDTTLALVPVGYADGLPRDAWERAEVVIRGRRRRLAGQISMDQFVVDVGDDDVHPGERVTIIGRGPGDPTLAEWSRWGACLPHEIITALGPRLSRESAT